MLGPDSQQPNLTFDLRVRQSHTNIHTGIHSYCPQFGLHSSTTLTQQTEAYLGLYCICGINYTAGITLTLQEILLNKSSVGITFTLLEIHKSSAVLHPHSLEILLTISRYYCHLTGNTSSVGITVTILYMFALALLQRFGLFTLHQAGRSKKYGLLTYILTKLNYFSNTHTGTHPHCPHIGLHSHTTLTQTYRGLSGPILYMWN